MGEYVKLPDRKLNILLRYENAKKYKILHSSVFVAT
jgi:hypothetical protein